MVAQGDFSPSSDGLFLCLKTMSNSSDIDSNQATKKVAILKCVDDEADDKLVQLIEVLLSIDSCGPLAKLNEISMPDNNGGRIKF